MKEFIGAKVILVCIGSETDERGELYQEQSRYTGIALETNDMGVVVQGKPGDSLEGTCFFPWHTVEELWLLKTAAQLADEAHRTSSNESPA